MSNSVNLSSDKSSLLDKSVYLAKTPWLQFILICTIFGLWGMAVNLNCKISSRCLQY